MRAKDKLRIDRSLASRTQWHIIEILEQVLLFQCTLESLV
jgi:hypothetical protein